MSFCRSAFVRAPATSSMKAAGARSSWICRWYSSRSRTAFGVSGRGMTQQIATEASRTSCVLIVVKQRLEPGIVHDAPGAADFLRDPVGTLLDATGCFGINRGAVDNPLHHGVQVCQDLQVNARGFGFGGAHTRIVLGTGSLSRTLIHEQTARTE